MRLFERFPRLALAVICLCGNRPIPEPSRDDIRGRLPREPLDDEVDDLGIALGMMIPVAGASSRRGPRREMDKLAKMS
jgi:hypothetical protein